jgi:hypothetical protein
MILIQGNVYYPWHQIFEFFGVGASPVPPVPPVMAGTGLRRHPRFRDGAVRPNHGPRRHGVNARNER